MRPRAARSKANATSSSPESLRVPSRGTKKVNEGLTARQRIGSVPKGGPTMRAQLFGCFRSRSSSSLQSRSGTGCATTSSNMALSLSPMCSCIGNTASGACSGAAGSSVFGGFGVPRLAMVPFAIASNALHTSRPLANPQAPARGRGSRKSRPLVSIMKRAVLRHAPCR